MSEGFKKSVTRAAKKGRRIAIAVAAGAVALVNIGYAQATGIEDI